MSRSWRMANGRPNRVQATGGNREVRYAECQKNHAAHIVGGFAVDGCQEFIAGPGAKGSETALSCDACGCHRDFHRAEEEEAAH